MFEGVNFLAVAVITAVIFVFGFVYYGPILGKQWMKLAGFTKEMQDKNQKRSMIPVVIAALVTTFIMVTVVAVLLEMTGASSATDALILSLLIWIGFYATTSLGSVLWEMKPLKLWFLNNGYSIIIVLAMGLGLYYWG